MLELFAYLLVPFACTLVLNWQNAKAFNARYVLVALPAWVVLLSLGFVRLGSVRRRVWAAGFAVLVAVSLGNLYFNPRYAREDVRAAVRYVEERGGSAPCLLAPTVWHVARLYAPPQATVLEYYREGDRDAQIDRVVATCNTLWYIRCRWWVDDPDGYLLERLREAYPQQQLIEFPGVELFLLKR